MQELDGQAVEADVGEVEAGQTQSNGGTLLHQIQRTVEKLLDNTKNDANKILTHPLALRWRGGSIANGFNMLSLYRSFYPLREYPPAGCSLLHTSITMATTSLDLLYSQIDVFPTFSQPPAPTPAGTANDPSPQLCSLLSELVSAQDRQTCLLEELVATFSNSYRRRFVELGLWKLSNPELAEYCKKAAKKLERIQNELLASITDEIETNTDVLFDSEFGLSEFIDRFGTKFLQLNSLLQILTQLGNAPDIQIPTQEIRRDY